MNTTNQHQEEDVIDLKELFFSILQHWPIVCITTLLALASAFFYLKVTLPVYSVNAMLQVESKSAGSDLLMGDIAGFDGKSEVATEIEIIKSRMVLGEVARNLNLDVVLTPVVDSKIDSVFRKDKQLLIHHDQFGVSYVTANDKMNIKDFTVAERLQDKVFTLTINNKKEYELSLMEGESTVILIKGYNGKPLEKVTDFGRISADISYTGLVNNKFSLQKKSLLTSSSSVLAGFSASEKGKSTGILSLSFEGVHKDKITNTLNEIVDIYVAKNLAKKTAEKEKTLTFLEEQLPAIKDDLELAEGRFNVFRNKNKTIDVTKEAQLLLEHSVRLEQTKLELEQKRAELSARFTHEYPLLKQVNVQIQTLLNKTNEVNNRLKALPSIQQQYLKLYRDVEINTQLYTSLLNNYQKLKIAKSGEIGNVRVIDKAVKPIHPIKPKKILIIFIAMILGLFIGVALIFLKNLFNSGVKDSNQIEVITGLPVLANIPRSTIQRNFFTKFGMKRMHNLLYLEDPQDMAIESLRSLRTALFFSMNEAKNNIIMITGPSPGIGKSFVSANFAAVLAGADKKVIVIDGDLRRGYLHSYYGEKNINGLSDFVTQQTTDPVRKTLIKTLDIIPRGKNPTNPAEILMSETFQVMLNELSEKYDYVIIDSPPTLAVTDSTVLGSMAGSTLVVARYGVSQLPEIKLTVDRLKATGCNVVGFIFNDVVREAGNTYGYQYGYNYKSK